MWEGLAHYSDAKNYNTIRSICLLVNSCNPPILHSHVIGTAWTGRSRCSLTLLSVGQHILFFLACPVTAMRVIESDRITYGDGRWRM